MNKIEKLFVIAMDDEAKDIVKEFNLIQETPFKLYKNNNNLLAISKVGKVNASATLSYLLAKYEVKLVINLGFVGASDNFKVGDVVSVKKALYHDFDATIFGYEKGQVPGLPPTYFSYDKIIDKFNYKEATLYTGDYFMTNKMDGSYLVDMEGAAFFQVAYINSVKMISIKVVSDIIGSKNHINEYNDFEKMGSKLIYDVYSKVDNLI